MPERPKFDSQTLKRLLSYMRAYKGTLVLVTVCILLSAVAGAASSMFLQKLIDGYIVPMLGTASPDYSGLIRALITIGCVYLVGTLATWLYNRRMVTIAQGTLKRIRDEMFEKMQRLPIRYFDTHTHGDIMSLYTNDTDTLRQMIAQSMAQLVSSVFTLTVVFFCMLYISIWLTLIVCAVMALILVFVRKLTGRIGGYFMAQQTALADLNGYVEEMYSGHEVVRISRGAENVKKHFGGLNEAVYNANWKSQFLSGIMQPLMNVIGNLAYVAVCVFGSMLALNGTITFGVIISFILYVRLFTSPLGQIAQGMTNMQTASASAQRIFDFIESEELPDESGKGSEVPEVNGNVSFENVRFSYPDTPDKVIIKNFSAEVKAGQKVAIVGPTGAGKTTMVNLLMRFFEINSGSISIDGTPISQLSRETVHNMFSMVLQDTWLFEGTVRENLVYNMEGISDESLERVCKACGLDKFVHTLPEGFDTVLSESVAISAGQKQLLTIARAMLQNAPMLILDEATSSVDTRTELLIQRAMDKLTKGRTSFVIAHRLSTIKNADLILVMRDGDVIESGNHETLMAKGGFYAELYNSQFDQAS